jgi:hypothetical protein
MANAARGNIPGCNEITNAYLRMPPCASRHVHMVACAYMKMYMHCVYVCVRVLVWVCVCACCLGSVGGCGRLRVSVYSRVQEGWGRGVEGRSCRVIELQGVLESCLLCWQGLGMSSRSSKAYPVNVRSFLVLRVDAVSMANVTIDGI